VPSIDVVIPLNGDVREVEVLQAKLVQLLLYQRP
jgi:hypothetical protein